MSTFLRKVPKTVAFCIVLLSSIFVSFRPSCLEVDVLLVLDQSQSVELNQKSIKDGAKAFINRFDLDEDGVKIGVILFGNYAWTVQPLSADRDEVLSSLEKLTIPMGSTPMTEAIEEAVNEFTRSGRPGYRKMIILVSDGAPDHPESAEYAAQLVQASGIVLCGVQVRSSEEVPGFMKRVCNCYVETSFAQLEKELRKLEVCM